MNSMIGGYSICLNKWSLDKEIKNELGLLLIISSLCAERGYCFASNQYLAKLFDVTDVSISTKIKKLEEKGYIIVEYEKRGCEVVSRTIRLKNILTDDLKKIKPTIKENFKENNISINNTSINKKENIKEKFIKPTLEQVQEYCNERNNNVVPERFIDFYESKGWMVGKNKMKDWRACIRTWEQKDKGGERLPSWMNNNNQREITQEEQDEFNDILNNFH